MLRERKQGERYSCLCEYRIGTRESTTDKFYINFNTYLFLVSITLNFNKFFKKSLKKLKKYDNNFYLALKCARIAIIC
jgi:hypothetical protein